jgi:sphingolipid delta-4 desaturase
MQTDFLRSTGPDPHSVRAMAILARYPKVRELFGHNPWTAAITAGIVAFQTAAALAIGQAGWPWWAALLGAAVVGAFANHALYVAIHDATHNLVFRRRVLNRWLLVLADLPNLLPGSMGFRGYHLLHHSHRSRYDGDPDIPNEWEARLVGNRWWRKAVWLALFPVLQLTRVPRVPHVPHFDFWSFANYVSCLLYTMAILWFGGWIGLLYLFASFFFYVGLHPLGARWISEHYTLDPNQDTSSYYGVINRLALNIGYHNEHHDFPRVPWNRLPRLTEMAPEFYTQGMTCHRSWFRLMLAFIFDERYTLYARVLRPASLAHRASETA